jgi:hypothetical protein
VSGSLSWTTVGDLQPAVRGLFISSLITVLASIGIANQQSTVLYRLSSNNNGTEILRSSLQRRGQPQEASRFQVFIWQAPSLLLIISILLFGLGLNIQLWLVYAMLHQDKVVCPLDFILKLLANYGIQDHHFERYRTRFFCSLLCDLIYRFGCIFELSRTKYKTMSG